MPDPVLLGAREKGQRLEPGQMSGMSLYRVTGSRNEGCPGTLGHMGGVGEKMKATDGDIVDATVPFVISTDSHGGVLIGGW